MLQVSCYGLQAETATSARCLSTYKYPTVACKENRAAAMRHAASTTSDAAIAAALEEEDAREAVRRYEESENAVHSLIEADLAEREAAHAVIKRALSALRSNSAK